MTFFRYIVVFETLPSGWVTGKARFASRSGMTRPLRRRDPGAEFPIADPSAGSKISQAVGRIPPSPFDQKMKEGQGGLTLPQTGEAHAAISGRHPPPRRL